MPKSSLALISWLLGMNLLVAVGCMHQDPADRSVEKLRADISKIEAERDRLDQRVVALEAAEHRREALASPAPPSIAPARPLPVVRVGETEARASSLPPAHDEAPDLDDTVAFSPEAKRDYDTALALARGKQYDKALQALTGFLVRFPDHPLVENAMYWRGECFYATGAFARAVDQFEGLIARFPYGNKAADALLKLGLAQEKVGAKDQAQKTFAELKDRYPKSDAARQGPHP
ncbi:MAG TPA: tol-pal system protein YbgF [Polyangiaceae bacterium]|jgi:tol-pal system protein YbgF|nr:tol-pal system protein YbgF [Polyangiaceae bacterium]